MTNWKLSTASAIGQQVSHDCRYWRRKEQYPAVYTISKYHRFNTEQTR